MSSDAPKSTQLVHGRDRIQTKVYQPLLTTPTVQQSLQKISYSSLSISWKVPQPGKPVSDQPGKSVYSTGLPNGSWTDNPCMKLSWFIYFPLSWFPGSVRPAQKGKEMMYINYLMQGFRRGGGEGGEEAREGGALVLLSFLTYLKTVEVQCTSFHCYLFFSSCLFLINNKNFLYLV